MFTPNRKRPGSSAGRRSNISLNTTPRSNTMRASSSSRVSLLRKSFAPRSPAVENTSMLSSPTVVMGGSHHNIESYPSSLPVLITEAITQADDFSEISAKLSATGWSVVVIQQRLFVWPHKPTGNAMNNVGKELRLPRMVDGFKHTAQHIEVHEEGVAVSVLAVTNNGHVQHWSNILASTTNFTEVNLESFDPTETCFNITSIQPFGYLVVTTTGAVYQVQANQAAITSYQLHSPKGLMSGISRRVSSFFFTPTSDTIQVVQATCRPGKGHGVFDVLLLTRSVMQQWKVVAGNQDPSKISMVAEMDVLATMAPTLNISNSSDFKIWPLDVTCSSRKNLIVCLVGYSTGGTIVRYAVCVFTDMKNSDFDVIQLDHSTRAEVTNPDFYPTFKLITEDPSSRFVDHIAVWSGETLVLKTVAQDGKNHHEDSIPFSNSGDRLVGAGHYGGRYIFLTIFNGLLTSSSMMQSKLPPTLEDSILNSSVASPMTPLDVSVSSIPGTPVMTQSRMEQLELSGNTAQKLQAAFLYFCRQNIMQAQSLVNEVFPVDKSNNSLDEAVIVVSTDLIDDYPASDPRWAESVQGVISECRGSTSSVILLYQLEDKQTAHAMFLRFLAEVGLWERLTTVSHGQSRRSTRWLMSEHVKKLCAAIALLQNHRSHQGVVDTAIKKVLEARGTTTNTGGLTAKDFFYRDVSKIEEIFEYLIEAEEKSLANSSLSSHERITLISGVNSVFETMLTSAVNHRRNKTLVFEDNSANLEFIPWTVGSGRVTLRSILTEQHQITIERGIPEANDQQRAALYQSLVVLTDLVMEGFIDQLKSLESPAMLARWGEVKSRHDRHRVMLIKPLLEIGQLEKAATLAEKYQDFDILVQVCEKSGGDARLQRYMREFADQGFCEFLFKWYLERKEYTKLLSCCASSPLHNKQLENFLVSHPKLGWMYQVKYDDYPSAQQTLQMLAANEQESAEAKKTYLSLGKLAAVFSGQPDGTMEEKVKDFNDELMILKYQESLPSVVLDSMHTTIDAMPVYPPSKLIQLYIGDGNQQSNEVDFKKAFELLQYLDAEDGNEMEVDIEEWKMLIWCKMILKDGWNDIDTSSDPFDAYSHTVLFRTIQLAQSSGLLSELLPDVVQLMNRPELSDLIKSSKFEFLLRATFERIHRTLLTTST